MLRHAAMPREGLDEAKTEAFGGHRQGDGRFD